MDTSLPGQLRDGMASRDGTSETLWGLWLQWSVLLASAVFAVIFSVLADHVLPPRDGLSLGVLLVDTAIFVPAVLLGLLGGLWPLRTLLARRGLGPLAVAVLAPLGATTVLCAAAAEFLALWTGSQLDELVARPDLTAVAMALAALPAMILAQEMIWPWRDRFATRVPVLGA